MKNKYILFLGLGDWDIPYLQIAWEHGYKTIVTNKDENSRALSNADVSLLADGQDVFSILSFLYSNHYDDKISYVYTGTELFTSVSIIAQSLRIPWHSPKAAHICEKKDLFLEKCLEHQIPHPTSFSVKSLEDVYRTLQFESNNKYIFKPSDSLCSKGVTIVGSEDEIKGAYKHALSNSPSKIVICGLYIEGTEFSVNGYLSEGKLIRLGVTDKIVGSFPHSIVIEVRCPSCISKKLQVDAYSLLEKASQAIGLTDGPIKADIIIDKKEKLFLLEVAPRFHGSLSSIHLIPEVTGITPFNEVLNLLEKKVYKEYDIDFTPNRSLFATAIDRKENCNPNGRILKWLEKPGITNREQWKSNYDTPLFAIWEKV